MLVPSLPAVSLSSLGCRGCIAGVPFAALRSPFELLGASSCFCATSLGAAVCACACLYVCMRAMEAYREPKQASRDALESEMLPLQRVGVARCNAGCNCSTPYEAYTSHSACAWM